MEEKLKLTVPTNEGQNVVGEEELKTLGDSVMGSGGGSPMTSTGNNFISGIASLSSYSWNVNGSVSWNANIGKYLDSDDFGSFEYYVTINQATAEVNLTGFTSTETYGGHYTKVIQSNNINGIIMFNHGFAKSLNIFDNVVIDFTSNTFHLQVTETIYDNDDDSIVSSRIIYGTELIKLKCNIIMRFNDVLEELLYDSASFQLQTVDVE